MAKLWITRGALLLIITFISHPLFGQKVEKLLDKNKVDKAIVYCEKQGDTIKAGCYMTIADYYLSNINYSAAEEYFEKSGNIEEGNKKIAESYMRGEIVESEWILNVDKVEDYLKKVHDDENQVYTIMAECFEKYGVEEKDRTEKFKKMADFGIISFSSKEGGTISIEKGYMISKIQTEMYFDLAASYYEKFENFEKAKELRKELEIFSSEFSIEQEQ